MQKTLSREFEKWPVLAVDGPRRKLQKPPLFFNVNVPNCQKQSSSRKQYGRQLLKPDASIIKLYYPKATVALWRQYLLFQYVRVCPAERGEGGLHVEMSKMQSYEERKKGSVEQTIQLPWRNIWADTY